MALLSLNIFSQSLGMQTNVQVVIPQQNTAGEIGVKKSEVSCAFKCLYLLHGLSDDQTIWLRRTSIERYATERGICVVMPFGARSFYSDMLLGEKYYTYIAKELPSIIESMLNVSDRACDRYIGGLSMGGYGAIKIALKESGRYNSAFGLSSVANIYNENFTQTLKAVFGDTISDDADLFKLISRHDKDEFKPRLYLTVGEQDFMFEDNLNLKEHLQKSSFDFTFVQTDGGHSWDLWDKTVQSALDWMLKQK